MGRPSKWRGNKALPAMPGSQSRMTPGIQPRYGAPSSNPIRCLDQFFLFGTVVDLRNPANMSRARYEQTGWAQSSANRGLRIHTAVWRCGDTIETGTCHATTHAAAPIGQQVVHAGLDRSTLPSNPSRYGAPQPAALPVMVFVTESGSCPLRYRRTWPLREAGRSIVSCRPAIFAHAGAPRSRCPFGASLPRRPKRLRGPPDASSNRQRNAR